MALWLLQAQSELWDKWSLFYVWFKKKKNFIKLEPPICYKRSVFILWYWVWNPKLNLHMKLCCVSILDGMYQFDYLCLSAFLGAGTLLGRQQNDRPSHCLWGPWGWVGARSWASHQPSAKRQSPDPDQGPAQAGCQGESWAQRRLAQRDSVWRLLHMWNKERALPAHPCFPQPPPLLRYCPCPSP